MNHFLHILVIATISLVSAYPVFAQDQYDDWSLEELVGAVGVYCWSVEVPDSLNPGHFLTTVWVLPDGKIEESGLSFKSVKRGSVVKIIIWKKVSPQGDMRFRLDFTDREGNGRQEFGKLKLPNGYIKPFGSAFNCLRLSIEEGNILYFYEKKSDSICILNFDTKAR